MIKMNNEMKTGLQKLQRPLTMAILCGSVALSVQGCVGLMVGGAVVGAMSASDRRTFGAQTEDRAIVHKGEMRMRALVGEAGHVDVNSFNRQVLLSGEVKDAQTKEQAGREIASIENVKAVVNELEIAETSGFKSRSNDALLTTKVKASLIDSKAVFANSFKVVSEAGTVFLMGRVTRREGDAAGEIARGVNGVQKVVKVFEYITEEELNQLNHSQ
ncbi:MAG: BON domain-containing protein [Pseudomonadota bacterium]